ncbi:DAK2 domain-containing protein [Carboxydothermus pertinax]|uniref:DAK2 domain protein n=1 Tax=Carboxydothermus pertinax TaxID=870242 RepID=A0A1L8CXY5_9THEO|nr:DAK2 domain-containing protein [Carboxydothermus pertinax]GAV23770.1 DAK2 domain protein [Carboxydothermus pertinax]
MEKLNGIDYAKMIIAAATTLEQNKEKLNQLNVFPVPDGDTGTNLAATMRIAAEKISQVKDDHLGKVADLAAQGALFGARGNSGVILSQVLRGFARGFKNKREAGVAELSKAFQYGVVYAYRAVAQPVEGTILTVLREIGKGFRKNIRSKNNIVELIEEAIQYGEMALAKTPELLPALKKAGVVDSGGMGLVLFLQGSLAGLRGENLVLNPATTNLTSKAESIPLKEEVSLDYIYCTEFIIKGEKLFLDKIRQELNDIGGSLIVAGDENTVKVHVHTNHPGEALELGLRWGLIYNIKIDNMLEQSQSRQNALKKLGTVAVSPGEGFSEIFKQLGIDEIIEGGQTNPSVAAIVDAINRVPAENVLVFPNNKNIILAAEQAKNLTNKNVFIVKTKNPAQTVTAFLYFNEEARPEELVSKMEEHIQDLKVIEITFAVRDVQFGDLMIKNGEYIAIFNGDIVDADKDLLSVALRATAKVVTVDSGLISIFTGEEVAKEIVDELVLQLQEKYENCDVEIFFGGQKNYPFYIAVE